MSRRAYTALRITIHAVGNPDQAPLCPGPRGLIGWNYSLSWITIRPIATFVWSSFREGEVSEVRRPSELQIGAPRSYKFKLGVVLATLKHSGPVVVQGRNARPANP